MIYAATKCLFAVALCATVLIPMRVAAQSNPQHKEQTNYRLIELPTLGGTQDSANFVNDRGCVTGAADLPGGHNEHAYLWCNGRMLDLGTLGGTNSLAWPVDNRGVVAGDSVTSTRDPFGENFCHFNIDGTFVFTDRTCLGFVWRRGAMTPLPTLGGNNSQVFGMNNRGQVVGTAEARGVDSNCASPQVLDYEPVVWEPEGEVQQLPLFPGDFVGAGVAINDLGEVVGGSGTCGPLNFSVAVHALLWLNGSVRYLGGFGGKMNNAAFDINNRNQIVGFSDLPGDTTTHAFLWQDGVMTDLGTLAGDSFSFAFSINDRGQVVGQSCDVNFNCRAFIWQNGVMRDVNALISHRSALYLIQASFINSRGEIAGIALEKSSGDVPAFLAEPIDGSAARPSASVPRVALPANVRRLLRRQGFARFGPGFTSPK